MGWGITREADIDSEERTRTIDIFPVVEESGKVSLITRVAKSAFILNREQRNAFYPHAWRQARQLSPPHNSRMIIFTVPLFALVLRVSVVSDSAFRRVVLGVQVSGILVID